jgi:hypothetical protein
MYAYPASHGVLDNFTAWKIRISQLWHDMCNKWKILDLLYDFI